MNEIDTVNDSRGDWGEEMGERIEYGRRGDRKRESMEEEEVGRGDRKRESMEEEEVGRGDRGEEMGRGESMEEEEV